MKRTTLLHHAPRTILGFRKNGLPIYPIAGASPDGDGEAGAKTGEGTGSDNGKPATGAETAAGESSGKPDLESEVAKWKELSRKNEARASANATAAAELAALKAANLTESEKAVSEAEQRGRAAATSELAQKIAAAEVRAALTGVVPDPAAIVEDLNLSKYVTETGDVNQEAVTALREKYSSFTPKSTPPDLKQGNQGNGSTKDLDTQIAEATAAGNTSLALSLTNQKLYAAPGT